MMSHSERLVVKLTFALKT